MTHLLLLLLVKAQVAAAAAMLVVLAVRPLLRRAFGPTQVYWLWAIVPAACLLSQFPNLRDFSAVGGDRLETSSLNLLQTPGAVALYLAGAAATLALFVAAEWRFQKLAQRGLAGPAVVGLSWPRIVTPADFEQRFTAAERRLIALHEYAHIDRDHPHHNRIIALLQVFCWFNPLSGWPAAARGSIRRWRATPW